MEKRTVAYAYEQHAIRMRLDYFDKSPVTNLYPFNGKFDFSQVEAAVKTLPFVSNKCGFVVGDKEEVLNYYCPALHAPFFDYLAVLGDSSQLIADFASDYQKAKTITPGIKQQMLLGNDEGIDFDNWDHQLFYLLFHYWVNEELMAYAKVSKAAAKIEK